MFEDFLVHYFALALMSRKINFYESSNIGFEKTLIEGVMKIKGNT